MALTTATVSPAKTHKQPGTFGARRARFVTVTFTSGYDSTTGVTLTAASCGLSEIYGVLPLDRAGGGLQALPLSFGIAPLLTETNQNDHQYDFNTLGASGLIVIVNISAFAVAAALTITITGVDAFGNSYTLLASTVLAATGVTVLQVSPAMTGIANLVGNRVLPDRVRIQTTHGNTNSITYSIAGVLTPG